MRKIIIDTSIWIEALKGRVTFTDDMHRRNEVLVPLPVIAELERGWRQVGAASTQRRDQLARLMQSLRGVIVAPDVETVPIYADLWNHLRQNGTPVAEHDIWIAALAIQHEAELLTRDQDFSHMPRLSISFLAYPPPPAR